MEQIIGALILAVGAFYGVWKGAAYATDRLVAQLTEERTLSDERLDAEARRLQMQLDAEAARLDKQLDAESARLDRQLAHDRWMREVEELRQLVDEAAAAGLAAGNAIHGFRGPVRFAVGQEGALGPGYLSTHQDAMAGVQGMQGFVERLELRLGRGQPLPSAYSSWQLTMEQSVDALSSNPPTKETLREGSTKLKEASGQYLAFMESARNYVELSPPSDMDTF